MYVATTVETCNCHPMGTLLMRLPQLTLHNCGQRRSGQRQNVRAAETSKSPIAPMGDSCFARFYRAAVSIPVSIPAPSR